MKALETERLILRDIVADDFAAVHSYASSVENTVYMPWGPNSEEQTKAYIEMAVAKARETPRAEFHFAITRKGCHTLVGGCGAAVSASDERARLGWILRRDHWNQGFGTEVARGLLRFCFEELKLRRVIANCDAENTASYRVMEKAGMRREGLFIEGAPAHKLSDRRYSDGLLYAILKDEWDAQKEIAFYNALPVSFDDFIELPTLGDGEIHLVCVEKKAAVPEKKYVPCYDFAICKGSEKVGYISFRVGYKGFGPDSSSLYYGGQIGYGVNEKHRGRGYAGRACRLIIPVAKAHGMSKLLITNNVTNVASRRVCEKLGARLLRVVRIPEWHDLYKGGQRYENIFEWGV